MGGRRERLRGALRVRLVLEHVASVLQQQQQQQQQQQATGGRNVWEIRGAGVLAEVLRLCDGGVEGKHMP